MEKVKFENKKPPALQVVGDALDYSKKFPMLQ